MTKVCTRCIYDDATPGISFDENGVCNYCKIHDEMEAQYPTGEAGWKKLEEMAAQIKKAGKGKKYDCIIGVSGGCDSSYLLHLSKKLGLRPLAVHFDNTWNSKIAVENIEIVLKKLDIDLWTYVMDNEEFNDLAYSMLKASIPEIDALTDIALTTTAYMAADKYKIKYILNGHSFRTEGITPSNWFYFDGKYIDSIHKQFGRRKVDKFPNLTLGKWIPWLIKDIKRLGPLYYIDYKKEDVKKFLIKEYGWKWYGGHHLENRYCAYNHYLLNTKFKRDLRYVEYSALIRCGQMTREQGIEEVNIPQEYPIRIISRQWGQSPCGSCTGIQWIQVLRNNSLACCINQGC
ncbi:MAG: N-acetyl sugar amidotransferase [Thermoplasmata archaeon]|nr:N-acetyl sugar amidotransferase [Thermoplasmata archaeon]